MEGLAVLLVVAVGLLALLALNIAFKFIQFITRVLSLLDFVLIGVGMWLLTHRNLEWHTALVIVSIVIPMGVWLVLSEIRFGRSGIRIFNIIGAIFSAVAAAILIDYQIQHPVDPLFGVEFACNYDAIWRVFVFVIVILIIGGIRLFGSVVEVLNGRGVDGEAVDI